jgi:hypothetical protein
MFRKFNTKTLIIILVLLFLAIALVIFMDKKKGGRTIREELVRVDTSKVSSISIFPQAENRKEIKIFRKGKKWMVQKENITAEAEERNITNLLNQFSLIRPQRLASNEKSHWKDYCVDDSLGNRVKIYSGNDLLADVIIGKFSFNNQTRSSISYVRLFGDDGTYSVDGYLSMLINQSFNMWRNKAVIRGEKNGFTKFTFQYPADTGFILSKENNIWEIGTINADSLNTDRFLADMTMLNSIGFVDDFIPTKPPVMILTIEGNNMSPITVKAFSADTVKRFIINSSFNPSVYFSAKDVGLDEKFFKGRRFFLNTSAVKRKTAGKK